MVTLDDARREPGLARVWTELGRIDISTKKVFTSRVFDIVTKGLASHRQSGEQFSGSMPPTMAGS